ncbi:MAG: nucleotidyl transferase AbiEii/AbiGii toxin family protein [Bacteroidales bacterium]|nr:nucleotidyl transferase AbiEii/AbiGii toxin family protein [Bacteroidales bacterium]
MILKSEIELLSRQKQIDKSQIDKDWVLSYLLLAIYSIPELRNIMIFKGGTCIKKCYIPDYRFSEDLDFTITDNKYSFNENVVLKITQKASELSYNEDFNRGIMFKLKNIESTKSNGEEQGFKLFLHYWGADHKRNEMPSDKTLAWHHTIKLDINHTEEILFPLNKRQINHNYSDKDKFAHILVNCYSIEEILSEKLRALIQRKYTSPRDCYDIWFLKNHYQELDWHEIKNAFIKKATNKKIVFEGVNQLINPQKEKILHQHWETQLKKQFPVNTLPEYNQVIKELKEFFIFLFHS